MKWLLCLASRKPPGQPVLTCCKKVTEVQSGGLSKPCSLRVLGQPSDVDPGTLMKGSYDLHLSLFMFPEERGMRGDINLRLPVTREGTSESCGRRPPQCSRAEGPQTLTLHIFRLCGLRSHCHPGSHHHLPCHCQCPNNSQKEITATTTFSNQITVLPYWFIFNS